MIYKIYEFYVRQVSNVGGDLNLIKIQFDLIKIKYSINKCNNCRALQEGDVITLMNRVDENWYEGYLNGRTGYFPVSYVQVNVPLPWEPKYANKTPLFVFHLKLFYSFFGLKIFSPVLSCSSLIIYLILLSSKKKKYRILFFRIFLSF